MFGKGQLDEKGLMRVQITFRTRPEVSTSNYAAKFRKEMSRSLMVGNYWVSEVRDYEGIRAFYLENSERTSAHRLVSAMGLFFLVNVFLAVIGTFWFPWLATVLFLLRKTEVPMKARLPGEQSLIPLVPETPW